MRKCDESDQKLAGKLDLKEREAERCHGWENGNHFEVSFENKTT